MKGRAFFWKRGDVKMQPKRLGASILGAVLAGASIAAPVLAASNYTLGDYPKPFVTDGETNFLIVVGARAKPIDVVGAIDIAARLGAEPGEEKTITVSGTTGGEMSISGEGTSLSTASKRIYLGDKINKAKNTLTSSDMPNLLASDTFEDDDGNTYDYDLYIDVGENQVKFWQEESDEDPILGIQMSTSSSSPLYTAKISFQKAVDFTDDDSVGNTLKLFGRTFTVSDDTDSDTLVLYKASQEITLEMGEETTVEVGGNSYTVKVIGFDTDSTPKEVVVEVNGETKSIGEGRSKKVGGLEIYAKTVTAWAQGSEGLAVLQVGSEKVILEDGEPVKVGDDEEEVEGTKVSFSGDPTSLSSIEIAVYAPDSDEDYIKKGEEFVDPVFGTFKVKFDSMANGPDASEVRETITIDGDSNSGTVAFEDSDGEDKTTQFVYYSGGYYVAGKDDTGAPYHLVEGEWISKSTADDDYIIVGREDYAHILEVSSLSIDEGDGTTDNDDYVKFTDKRTGETYKVEFEAPSSGDATKDFYIEGKKYTLTYNATLDKFKVEDAETGTNVFPTIETSKGAELAITKNDVQIGDEVDSATIYLLPTGYIKITPNSGADTAKIETSTDGSSWTTVATAASGDTEVSLGKLDYIINITQGDTGSDGKVDVYVSIDGDLTSGSTSEITKPAIVLIEEENDNTDANEVVIVPFNYDSDDGVGTEKSGILTSDSEASYTASSDDDVYYMLTSYGTYIKEDRSDDVGKVTITYPDDQMYANIAVLATEASVSTTEATEGQTVTYEEVVPIKSDVAALDSDSAVSAAKTEKNLILVGGPAVNALVRDLFRDKFNVSTAEDGWIYGAQLAEANYCGENGVYDGEQGLIKLVNDAFTEGKVALIVMGCDTEGKWTKAASRVLQQYDDYADELAGKEEVRLTGSVENPTIS